MVALYPALVNICDKSKVKSPGLDDLVIIGDEGYFNKAAICR